MASVEPTYVKVTLLIKKRPDMDNEQFHEHWSGAHAHGVMQFPIFHEKIRRYNQYCVTTELRAMAQELGSPVAEYDGIAEIWVDKLKDWKDLCADDGFSKFIQDDKANFLASPLHIMLGYDNLVLGTDNKTGMETQIDGKLVEKSAEL